MLSFYSLDHIFFVCDEQKEGRQKEGGGTVENHLYDNFIAFMISKCLSVEKYAASWHWKI